MQNANTAIFRHAFEYMCWTSTACGRLNTAMPAVRLTMLSSSRPNLLRCVEPALKLKGHGSADLSEKAQNNWGVMSAAGLCSPLDRILDDVLQDKRNQGVVAIGLQCRDGLLSVFAS